MNPSKHHLRSSYEQLLRQLSTESKMPCMEYLGNVSDYNLLVAINDRLRVLDCQLLSSEELEMELI